MEVNLSMWCQVIPSVFQHTVCCEIQGGKRKTNTKGEMSRELQLLLPKDVILFPNKLPHATYSQDSAFQKEA